ncbi:MAG: DUF4234 domain-containing protein [Candidatus Saccharimonadales bacterium]
MLVLKSTTGIERRIIMKNRSPIAVFLLTFITFGIYGIVWYVKTKGEMNKLGADIPTAWLLIIPIVNYYWLWKYSEGVEKVTKGKISGILSFVMLLLLSVIAIAILQNEFNKVGETASAAPAGGAAPIPSTPISPTPQPDNSFGGPQAESTPPSAPAPDTPAPTPPEDPTSTPPPEPIS